MGYRNGKPGPDLRLSTDRAWSHPHWAALRVTDLEPRCGSPTWSRAAVTDLEPRNTGALVYWRVEGNYRPAPAPPLPVTIAGPR